MQAMPNNGHPAMPDLPPEQVGEIDQNISKIQELQNKTKVTKEHKDNFEMLALELENVK